MTDGKVATFAASYLQQPICFQPRDDGREGIDQALDVLGGIVGTRTAHAATVRPHRNAPMVPARTRPLTTTRPRPTSHTIVVTANTPPSPDIYTVNKEYDLVIEKDNH